jgi:hypothetical protein
MPKSRGRKPRRSQQQQKRQYAGPSHEGWGESEPWIRAMMMADEAEATGDAVATLEIMDAFAIGPDGRAFWRPWRAKYLAQIAMLGPILPGWVYSRWICSQAMQSLAVAKRGPSRRAFDLTVELRGGESALPGVDAPDAEGRVLDHDWVYRQLFLYELGGLELFVRDRASSALLAGADSIHRWSRCPMGGYRLLDSTPDSVAWLDLGTEQTRSVPNTGSACLVSPGEHVIGRLVPIETGELFESCPVLVSGDVAGRVAADPPQWLDVLRRFGTGNDEDLGAPVHSKTLLSDVPTVVWQLAILDGSRRSTDVTEWVRSVTRRLLDVAAREVADPVTHRPHGEVDRWSCLGAAFLEPYVVTSLPDVAEPHDRGTLEQLGALLAEPAASLCNEAARELFDAA